MVTREVPRLRSGRLCAQAQRRGPHARRLAHLQADNACSSTSRASIPDKPSSCGGTNLRRRPCAGAATHGAGRGRGVRFRRWAGRYCPRARCRSRDAPMEGLHGRRDPNSPDDLEGARFCWLRRWMGLCIRRKDRPPALAFPDRAGGTKNPVYGGLQSTWPAASGVLVEDGVAYVAAGIVNYDQTYVYALDAETGRVKWANDTSGHLNAQARCGVSVQGHLLLHDGKLYMAGGTSVSPAVYDATDGKCLNDPNAVQKLTQNNVLFSENREAGSFLCSRTASWRAANPSIPTRSTRFTIRPSSRGSFCHPPRGATLSGRPIRRANGCFVSTTSTKRR